MTTAVVVAEELERSTADERTSRKNGDSVSYRGQRDGIEELFCVSNYTHKLAWVPGLPRYAYVAF